MKIINNKKYYTAKEVGMLIKRSHLTIHLWDIWSRELEKRGEKRFIPKPLTLGKQNIRYWSEDQIEEIKRFVQNIKRGDLAEFSRRVWDTEYRHEFNKKNKLK